MALEFGETLGIDIQLRTSETFEKFASELAAGSYDIALAHPFLYVDAHEAQGYEAIASVDQKLRAVIVSRRTQPVGRLAELRGQTLALPPLGAGVSYLLRLAMVEEGLIPDVDLHLRYHRTKVSCLHAVAWSHIDPSRARRELRTLAAAQRPDGLIGHTVFWSSRVRPAPTM